MDPDAMCRNDIDSVHPNDDSAFLSGMDWWAAGITASITLGFYVYTLAPTVTLEQSGAFVVAADYLGIGRVPGYPLWHLLAHMFTKIFSFMRYHGHPNPAWATNFMSAFFGALSCGLIALLISRVGRGLIGNLSKRWPVTVSAIAAGLLFAVSHAMWSQSVVTETHTLTLFLFILFLIACLAWFQHPGNRTACSMAAVFGLGLGQSHMLILLLPSLLLALLIVRPALCREFCISCLFVWVVPVMLITSDLSRSYAIAACVLSIVFGLVLPLRRRADRFTVLAMVSLISCGLILYAYLPLASEGNPPMQFGYSRTWGGFMFTITRGQYERMHPTNVFDNPGLFLRQLGWYLERLQHQYFLPAAAVGVLPLFLVNRFRGPLLKWWTVVVLTFLMFSIGIVIGCNPQFDLQEVFILSPRFIPSFAVWGIFVGLGFLIALDWLCSRNANTPHAQDPGSAGK